MTSNDPLIVPVSLYYRHQLQLTPIDSTHNIPRVRVRVRIRVWVWVWVWTPLTKFLSRPPITLQSSVEDVSSLLLDTAALACKWDKPLSCRLFPVPGKGAGEMTEFDSPYLINSRVFALP